jgi:hypothetical protein
MAKRNRYGLDKRLKELKKKKKRDEKLERKRMKKQDVQNDAEENREVPAGTTDGCLVPDVDSKQRVDP